MSEAIARGEYRRSHHCRGKGLPVAGSVAREDQQRQAAEQKTDRAGSRHLRRGIGGADGVIGKADMADIADIGRALGRRMIKELTYGKSAMEKWLRQSGASQNRGDTRGQAGGDIPVIADQQARESAKSKPDGGVVIHQGIARNDLQEGQDVGIPADHHGDSQKHADAAGGEKQTVRRADAHFPLSETEVVQNKIRRCIMYGTLLWRSNAPSDKGLLRSLTITPRAKKAIRSIREI